MSHQQSWLPLSEKWRHGKHLSYHYMLLQINTAFAYLKENYATTQFMQSNSGGRP